MGEIVTDINLFSCLEVEMYTFRHKDILINSISKTTIILVITLDLVTVLRETKSVTKSRLHCSKYEYQNSAQCFKGGAKVKI